MGITGLLPFVKNSCRPANIKDFAGSTVAIDAYSWLHKGAFSCAEKLVKGEKTDGYIFYCIKLLNMLIDSGVTPVMVFDGCNLASKAITEKKRRENREKSRQRGKELLCEGKIKEARECFQRCVDVTPEMAKEVIQACQKKSIDCIVAPYEADAQLAYLDKAGFVDLIITEDSDLILFGCSKILFKMDGGGGGSLYEKENLPKSFGANASKFSFEKFRYMCILSGCDYLPSLPGIGLVKACKFFSLTTITDLSVLLTKLPSYLKMPKLVVSNEYKESFIKANNTFLYQLAYCPKQKRLAPLNPYPEGITADDMEYAGKYMDDELAYQLAIGNINVKTLKEFDTPNFGDSPNYDYHASAFWGVGSTTKKNLQGKKDTAFKFNTPKRKVEATQKRKYSETERENPGLAYDDLFSQYNMVENKKSKCHDSDEDPLIPSCSSDDITYSPAKDSVNESIELSESAKKIVKSRFFSSQSSQSSTESGIYSLSSSFNNKNEDFLCTTEISVSPTTTVNEDSETLSTPINKQKADEKENIRHRFAKKKSTDACTPLARADSVIVNHSTPKQESVSLLDIFNDESVCTTSTLSSAQKSAKILSQTVTDSATKLKPKSLFFKKESSKTLITTRIHDFKWIKEPTFKSNTNTSLSSDGCSLDQSLEESPKCQVSTKSPLKEISPYFLNGAKDTSAICENSETVITITSDCEDEIVEISSRENKMKSPKKSSSAEIPTKCRTIGLSKKRKSCGAVKRKETLLNFNFTRKSDSVATS